MKLLPTVFLSLFAAPQGALSSKFFQTFSIPAGSRFGPVMEGPMYSVSGFWGIVTGTPVVGFEGDVTLNQPQPRAKAVLNIIHTYSPDRLAIYDDASAMPAGMLCQPDGQPEWQTLSTFGRLGDQVQFALEGGKTTHVDWVSPVTITGYQHVIFVLCHPSTNKVGGIEVEVQGNVIFKNPYGYLPAVHYGLLPYMGILSTLYFALLLIFGYLLLKYRREALRVQFAIFAVILMGFVETTTWFLTYLVMNEEGGAACCPWRTDVVFCIVTNNFKRAVSAILVLSVALGWGVVKPRLSRRTFLILIGLGFLYCGLLLKFDLVRMENAVKTDTSTETGQQDAGGDDALFWSLPLAFVDVVLMFWIYSALQTTQVELAEEHQDFKLQMYQRLSRTLKIWTVLWVIYTIFEVMVRAGTLPWPWTMQFLLYGFWDALYLGILFTIASIWRPAETSAQLAYSMQLPTDNVLDEFETANSNELEMPRANAPSEDENGEDKGGILNHSSNGKPGKKSNVVTLT